MLIKNLVVHNCQLDVDFIYLTNILNLSIINSTFSSNYISDMKFLTTVIKIFGVTKLKIDKIKFLENSNITFIDIIPLYKNIFLDKI
jgi:hypothetical protein